MERRSLRFARMGFDVTHFGDSRFESFSLKTIASDVFPSPGTPGEGRVRVFFRDEGKFPSPQPSPGVPGEGVKARHAIVPSFIRGWKNRGSDKLRTGF